MKWVSAAVITGSIIYLVFFGSVATPVLMDVGLNDQAISVVKTAEPDIIAGEIEESVDEINKTVEFRVDTLPDQLSAELDTKPLKKPDVTGPSPILVNEIVFCREISGRQPVGPGERFPSSVESISCYTSIRNLNPIKQEIFHEWRLNGALMSRVPMELFFSYNWRCWSQVSITPDREGIWTVTVKDTIGNILDEAAFTVVSEDQY